MIYMQITLAEGLNSPLCALLSVTMSPRLLRLLSLLCSHNYIRTCCTCGLCMVVDYLSNGIIPDEQFGPMPLEYKA